MQFPDAKKWALLTRHERARVCRDMAAEAEELAGNAPAETKDPYFMLASEWLRLAAEIEDSK
jgi:hypothetical protein